MEVVNYDERLHLEELTNVAYLMRHSETAYPPHEFCGESKPEVNEWLKNCHSHTRWVAVNDNKVIGHISLAKPEDYLSKFLHEHSFHSEFDEVSKFFVHPEYRKTGAGRLLFAHALASSPIPKALAVLAGSIAARKFYVHHGMTEIGIYHGISGVNHIFGEVLE